MEKFRYLKPNEVDVFPKMVKKNGCLVLLYKDARCDMNILDETVGPLGWKREHSRENANCTVSIYDSENKHWVSKEDTGTESNQDKEKGLASDSFKRACFNWGIGRELYTAPFMWINLQEHEFYCTNPKEEIEFKKKYALDKKLKFKVTEMEVFEGEIVKLIIKDQSHKVRFSWSKSLEDKNDTSVTPTKNETVKTKEQTIVTTDEDKANALDKLIEKAHISKKSVLSQYGVSESIQLTTEQLIECVFAVESYIKKKEGN